MDAPPGVDAVGGRAPVLLDSGVRSGADAALAGADGVEQVVRDVLAELDLTVGLAGARTPAEVEVRERR